MQAVTVAVRHFANSYILFTYLLLQYLQCFDAVGWAAGRVSGL